MDAEGGEKGLEIACGHVLSLDLDVDDGFVLGRMKRAGQMRRGAADLERGRFQDARVLAEIVFRIEIHSDGNASWRATSDKQGFREFDVALGFGFTVLRGKRAVEIDNASQTHGR